MSARSEFTLDEALADPIVQAVMAADRVDRKELDDMLARITRTLEARSPRQRSPVQTAVADRKIRGLGNDLDARHGRSLTDETGGNSIGQARDRKVGRLRTNNCKHKGSHVGIDSKGRIRPKHKR